MVKRRLEKRTLSYLLQFLRGLCIIRAMMKGRFPRPGGFQVCMGILTDAKNQKPGRTVRSYKWKALITEKRLS